MCAGNGVALDVTAISGLLALHFRYTAGYRHQSLGIYCTNHEAAHTEAFSGSLSVVIVALSRRSTCADGKERGSAKQYSTLHPQWIIPN